jgi:hypothetical protein
MLQAGRAALEGRANAPGPTRKQNARSKPDSRGGCRYVTYLAGGLFGGGGCSLVLGMRARGGFMTGQVEIETERV